MTFIISQAFIIHINNDNVDRFSVAAFSELVGEVPVLYMWNNGDVDNVKYHILCDIYTASTSAWSLSATCKLPHFQTNKMSNYAMHVYVCLCKCFNHITVRLFLVILVIYLCLYYFEGTKKLSKCWAQGFNEF